MKYLIRFWDGNQHMTNELVDDWPRTLKEWRFIIWDNGLEGRFQPRDMPRNVPKTGMVDILRRR